MRLTRLLPATVAATVAFGALAVPTPAGAAAPDPDPTPTPVPAPDNARVTFSLIMNRPEAAARKKLRAVSDPRSSAYRHFPGRDRIRTRYGADPHDLRVVTRSAKAAGLTPVVDPTGLFVRVTGRVSALEPWLGHEILVTTTIQPFDSRSVQRTRLFLLAHTTPPPALSGVVRSVVPFWVKLTTYTAVSSQQLRPVAPNRGTYIGGCRAAQRENTYSFDQLASAYGTDELRHDQAVAKASRMAIIASGEGFGRRSLRHSARCFDVPGRSFTRIHVPGMTGNLPEGGEGDLDTQVAQAVMPRGSMISVIESPPVMGTYYLAWAAAFGLKKLPDAVSQSYGICESLLDQNLMIPEVRLLTDAVLVRLGLAGTTATSSAGDDGSSGCYEGDKTTPAAVEYPTSSPYITSVGGSRIVLDRRNERRNEVVWHDVNRTMVVHGKTAPVPTSGGGGGRSTLYDRPWYQRGPWQSTTRTVPDLAMHASFGPGWPVYLSRPAAQQFGARTRGFYAVAGTSASSPYFASNVALLAAGQRLAGLPPYGHVAPALYPLARRHRAAFFDITTTTNDLYDVGCCDAHRGYDLASGLGAPNFDVFPRWLGPRGLG
ncbi:MAG: S53 family serine peptidase [Candidatus Nanopelagicales bacterium]